MWDFADIIGDKGERPYVGTGMLDARFFPMPD